MPIILMHSYFQTNATSVLIIPRGARWSEYRVMSINEYGTSDYSLPSKAVYVMPNRPSPPQHFRVVTMMRRQDKVSVILAWSKPLISGIIIVEDSTLISFEVMI